MLFAQGPVLMKGAKVIRSVILICCFLRWIGYRIRGDGIGKGMRGSLTRTSILTVFKGLG